MVNETQVASVDENSFRCLIIGSRDFANFPLFCKAMDIYLEGKTSIELVSGGCKTGADRYAEIYAEKRGYPIKVFSADWSKGKRAGYIRNRQMHEYIAQFPNRGVMAFWDGASKGTAQSFELTKQYENPIKIYNYVEKRCVNNPVDDPPVTEEQPTLRR